MNPIKQLLDTFNWIPHWTVIQRSWVKWPQLNCPTKKRKATQSGVNHSDSRCCRFNASTTKHSTFLSTSGSTSRQSAGFGWLSARSQEPCTGLGAVPPAGAVPVRQVCVADAQRLLLAQPRAGPLCVLPPRKQLVALVKYKWGLVQ